MNETGLTLANELGPSYRVPRGIIFDLDGVIVDSLPVTRNAFAAAYLEIVGPGEPPFEEYCKHLGLYFPDIMHRMGLPGEMYASFTRESARRLSDIRVYPQIDTVVAALRRSGVACAIATGRSGERARAVLDALGLLDAFAIVRGADEVTSPKPAPEILLSLLDHLDLEPLDALFVGDAKADLECSRAAQVRFAAACWGDEVRDEVRKHADICLDAPGDLLALVVEGEHA
jgi:AHBA synthesis associated protein